MNNHKHIGNSMYLTLGQAAEMCGWSKGAISKAIKSGKMSVHKKTKAGFQLDPSEVLRVFPKKRETSVNEQLETPSKHNGNSTLSAEVNALHQQILTTELERVREREQLTDRIESLQQMLADEKSERRQLTAQREKDTRPQSRGFWARLKGG
jgi:putative ubiquitin-RnfH superfamily antitoxin RatB of RatAB toxin-antitoxin module